MTPSSRRLPRHGALPKSVARPVLAALTVLSVVLVTALAVHLGVGPAAALNGAGPQGATVQVAQPGRHYISSSSTDRPVLSLSGWTDARGQALDAPDNAQTKAVAVHIRVVDEDGWYQAGVVYPEFIAGQADYALPLWPFTNDMDPHEGTYRIEWRASSSDPWVLADTIGLDVRLPQPGPCAGLEQSGSSLVGTGWTFDRTTSFGGIYKVALALALPDGTVSHVNVRAYFSGTRFLLDIADLVAAGAPAGGGYTVTALAHGQPTTTSVRIPSAPVEQPMSSPQPSPSPSAEPTADPTVEPTADPTAAPTAEPSAEPVPSIEPTAQPTTDPTTEPTAEPTAAPTTVQVPEPSAEPTAQPTTAPTTAPPAEPTAEPVPSIEPSAEPSAEPSTEPPAEPTTEPTAEAPSQPVEPAEPEPTAAPVEPVLPEPTAEPEVPTPEPVTTATAPTERSTPEPAAEQEPAEDEVEVVVPGDPNARPETEPSSPVSDPGQLDASNAGSLSGTRNGDKVTFILPSSKAKEGDWVAVFIYPGARTAGWVQVDGAQSVSIDVSGFEAGTYQVAIADRDSELLGWAQLEIEAVSAPAGEGANVLTIGAEQPGHGLLGPGDWMLVTAGGLLALAAGAVILLVRPATLAPWRRGRAEV